MERFNNFTNITIKENKMYSVETDYGWGFCTDECEQDDTQVIPFNKWQFLKHLLKIPFMMLFSSLIYKANITQVNLGVLRSLANVDVLNEKDCDEFTIGKDCN